MHHRLSFAVCLLVSVVSLAWQTPIVADELEVFPLPPVSLAYPMPLVPQSHAPVAGSPVAHAAMNYAEPDAFVYEPVEEIIAPLGDIPTMEDVIVPLDMSEQGPIYSWYDIRGWMPEDEWELSFELGINGTAGNSETLSQVAGFNFKQVYDVHTLRIDALYNQASTGSTTTADNAMGRLRYDRDLGETRWSLFSNSTLEYDAFRAYDMRVATNGGFGYQLIDAEKTKFKGRFGAGASQEIGGPDNDVVPEAVFGFDFEHHFREGSKLTCETDYYPEWGNFNEYRVNTVAGWEMPIDSLLNLSMKLAIINRYDSTPDSLKPNDLTYSLLFLWRPL